ncbi:hypothetical protein U1Q18_006164 [Sarracenia purpurea var. burkii]
MACRILYVCFFLFGVAGLFTGTLVILSVAEISFVLFSSMLLTSSLLWLGSCAAVSWGLAPVGWMDQPGSCDMRGCFVCWMVVFLGMEWLMALGGLLLFFWHCSGEQYHATVGIVLLIYALAPTCSVIGLARYQKDEEALSSQMEAFLNVYPLMQIHLGGVLMLELWENHPWSSTQFSPTTHLFTSLVGSRIERPCGLAFVLRF